MSRSEPLAIHGTYRIGERIHADDFAEDRGQWVVEAEAGGRVAVNDGRLVIDVPGGCSVWFKPAIDGPVTISYTATIIKGDGPNDRVSDLNCFWMATDARGEDFFAVERRGKFADYDQLRCYYVGQGGNTNTTTRFRRYIGQRDNRPLLPEHDRKDPAVLLEPNRPYRIQLVAFDGLIQYICNGTLIFELRDDQPYRRGHFAFRTVANHMTIDDFAVHRLVASEDAK